MKKIFVFLGLILISCSLFSQKINDNGEKLIKSITVLSNSGKILNKFSYFYDEEYNMKTYIRDEYKFHEKPQSTYKIIYNNGKFHGERYYEGRLTNEKYYYDNIDNRITMSVCLSKNSSNTLFKNRVDFHYDSDNNLNTILFTDSYREENMTDYITSAELKEYLIIIDNNKFKLFFRNKYYTNNYTDLSTMCGNFTVYNNTNINLLQFFDYSNSAIFNNCDELYTEWTNYNSKFLPNKILNKQITYYFDDNENIVEIKVGKFKVIKLEYVY